MIATLHIRSQYIYRIIWCSYPVSINWVSLQSLKIKRMANKPNILEDFVGCYNSNFTYMYISQIKMSPKAISYKFHTLLSKTEQVYYVCRNITNMIFSKLGTSLDVSVYKW